MNKLTTALFNTQHLSKLAPVKILSWSLVMALFLAVWTSPRACAQDLDVPYVPTPTEVVNKMLEVADVGSGDYVIDLGSGDGRIVIAAAQLGAYGHGVDIDPERISEARENAEKADVSDHIMFLQENIFNTDFSRANVITMYLLNSVNIKLRPKILNTLEPGTRLVSHDFDMNDWEPDKYFNMGEDDVYYWVIPAKAEGQWIWEIDGKRIKVNARQKYQEIRLDVISGDEALMIKNESLKLVGRRIGFQAVNLADGTRYVYHGEVEGNTIKGKVQIHGNNNGKVENWSATISRNTPVELKSW
mgnify:CR=1 FL=1